MVAAVALIAGCDGGDDDGDGTSAPGAPERGAANGRPTEPTAETRCQVGRPPDYFVPKPEKSPLATIGCARLGVSSKPVEFSANSERIGRRGHVCLNPAYGDRGRRGLYIPAACVRAPVSRRLDVVSVEVPRGHNGVDEIDFPRARG